MAHDGWDRKPAVTGAGIPDMKPSRATDWCFTGAKFCEYAIPMFPANGCIYSGKCPHVQELYYSTATLPQKKQKSTGSVFSLEINPHEALKRLPDTECQVTATYRDGSEEKLWWVPEANVQAFWRRSADGTETETVWWRWLISFKVIKA